MATVVTSPSRAAPVAQGHRLPALVMGWHLLSLDAPSVAALWTIFFARRFGVALSWTVPAALALAVWMLYALDRLADAARPHGALAERHRFHHRHRVAFLGAIAGAVPALTLLIVLLPSAVRTGWLLLALPMALYVVVVHGLRLRRVPKEHLVGVFFAVATAMPVLVSRAVPAGHILPAMALFGTLCWLNCVAIARWERAPGSDGATAWAASHFLPAIAALLAAVALLVDTSPAAGAACACSAVLLLVLEWTRPRPILLRALADAALLTPLAILPFLR